MMERVAAADVLRPQILTINGIRYRRNIYFINEFTRDHQNKEETNYRMKDVEACDIYEDERCDGEDFEMEETKRGFKATLKISVAFFKFIIGIRGETKRKIETETNVKITLPPRGVEGDVVILGEEKRNVSSACTRISLIVESERKKFPFSHFLSFSVVSHSITDNYEEFMTQVLMDCWANGIDESIFQNSKKLHLTLGVMVLIDKNYIEKAGKVLQNCKESLQEKGLFGSPLNVKVSGLEYMNDDPNSVDVLYAKVHLEDGSDRLQVIADEFVQSFVSSGLMVKQYDRVKLHITIMNTLFRKDGDSGAQEHKGRRARECFNATHILRKLKTFEFGTVQLKGLHLSRKHSVNSSGYYESDYYIEF